MRIHRKLRAAEWLGNVEYLIGGRDLEEQFRRDGKKCRFSMNIGVNDMDEIWLMQITEQDECYFRYKRIDDHLGIPKGLLFSPDVPGLSFASEMCPQLDFIYPVIYLRGKDTLQHLKIAKAPYSDDKRWRPIDFAKILSMPWRDTVVKLGDISDEPGFIQEAEEEIGCSLDNIFEGSTYRQFTLIA